MSKGEVPREDEGEDAHDLYEEGSSSSLGKVFGRTAHTEAGKRLEDVALEEEGEEEGEVGVQQVKRGEGGGKEGGGRRRWRGKRRTRSRAVPTPVSLVVMETAVVATANAHASINPFCHGSRKR